MQNAKAETRAVMERVLVQRFERLSFNTLHHCRVSAFIDYVFETFFVYFNYNKSSKIQEETENANSSFYDGFDCPFVGVRGDAGAEQRLRYEPDGHFDRRLHGFFSIRQRNVAEKYGNSSLAIQLGNFQHPARQ
jgi:hypothetical protein